MQLAAEPNRSSRYPPTNPVNEYDRLIRQAARRHYPPAPARMDGNEIDLDVCRSRTSCDGNLYGFVVIPRAHGNRPVLTTEDANSPFTLNRLTTRYASKASSRLIPSAIESNVYAAPETG